MGLEEKDNEEGGVSKRTFSDIIDGGYEKKKVALRRRRKEKVNLKPFKSGFPYFSNIEELARSTRESTEQVQSLYQEAKQSIEPIPCHSTNGFKPSMCSRQRSDASDILMEFATKICGSIEQVQPVHQKSTKSTEPILYRSMNGLKRPSVCFRQKSDSSDILIEFAAKICGPVHQKSTQSIEPISCRSMNGLKRPSACFRQRSDASDLLLEFAAKILPVQ